MKKIIFLIIFLGVSSTTQAQTEPQWRCIQDNNNFIVFYPFRGYWAIVTDKDIKAAKRAEGITTGNTTQVTATVVKNAPEGSNLKLWTSGAIENNLTAYIEPLCYF